MEKIQLHSVLPQVFAQRNDLDSEIWKQDVTFEKGHLYLIEAESGSGKSTFCSYVLGYRHDYSGSVMFDNDVTANYKVKDWVEMRKRHISHLFQELRLFPELTALENVEIKNKITGFKTREQILKWFDMLGIADKVDAKIGRMSFGQQQRVALARILASDPEVLMLDEPFSALDAFLKEKLQLELLELLSGYDKDILMVTHSRDEIYRFCEHMLIVEDGRQAGFGVTKEIFKNPGTPAAAKLTGCKNIEKIERVDDHTMVLPNWNTTVCVKGMIPENTTHIGIRAHYLRLPENGQRENLVECQNGKILDDPFELVVVFEHDVWWKIPKESWQKEYQEKMPQYLAIPEESILYLHG